MLDLLKAEEESKIDIFKFFAEKVSKCTKGDLKLKAKAAKSFDSLSLLTPFTIK
jgi:hypothetical protein